MQPPFLPSMTQTTHRKRDPQQQLKDNHAKMRKNNSSYKQPSYFSQRPLHGEKHSAIQLPWSQYISSSKSIPVHLQKAYTREITVQAIALTYTSLCWPRGKNKQPVNLAFKQFAISHYPDSRGPLCFSLPPLHCANRKRSMKAPISLAEPSLAKTSELSSQQL